MNVSKVLFELYKVHNNRLRRIILKLVYKIEGGEYYSLTLRNIYKEYHKIEVGLYSHGGCFSTKLIDKHTTFGRYCSTATSVRIMNRNHPMEFKSMHALFFNPRLKFVEKDSIEYIPLKVGNDVWIGHNAIIMPHVTEIGDGAVVGAGAVVNKNIPPYAVVVGNPSRIVRFRFTKKKVQELLDSKWWEKTIEEISKNIDEYQRPLELIESDNNTDDG